MKQKICIGITLLAILMLQGCGQSVREQVSENVWDDGQSTSEQVSDSDFTPDTEQSAAPIVLDFAADINHNGVEDVIQIRGNGNYGCYVYLSVVEEGKQLYSTCTVLNAGMGEQFYLVHQNGRDYIMRYFPLMDHDMAFCEYEVFFLDEKAEVAVEAYGSIELSLFDAEEIDMSAWTAFAEMENVYFTDAVLMLSASEGELVCGDSEQPIQYTENFSWMIFSEEPSLIMEQNLESFIEEYKDYGD